MGKRHKFAFECFNLKGFLKKHSVDVEKREPSSTAEGNVKWNTRRGKQSGSSSKS